MIQKFLFTEGVSLQGDDFFFIVHPSETCARRLNKSSKVQ